MLPCRKAVLLESLKLTACPAAAYPYLQAPVYPSAPADTSAVLAMQPTTAAYTGCEQ